MTKLYTILKGKFYKFVKLLIKLSKKLDLHSDFARVYPSLPDFTEFDRVNSSQTHETFRFYQKSSLPPS